MLQEKNDRNVLEICHFNDKESVNRVKGENKKLPTGAYKL